MKAIRSTRWAYVLVVTLVLGAVATIGGVGPAGTEPLAVIAGTSAVQSSSDIVLEIEGIPGESTVTAHKGTMDVLSWNWGVSQTAGVGTVSVIKRIDKATPLLFGDCIDGTVIALATVYLTRQDGQTYLEYELADVVISSISHGGDVNGDGLPDETLQLRFDGATLTYTQFDATGKPVGQTTAER